MVAHVRFVISHLVAFAVTVSQVAPAATAQSLSKPEYEACQARDEASFHAAIEAISIKALNAGIANVDYRAVVGDEWRRGGLDEIVDTRVDLAVEEVRQQTSWGNLLQSLASQQKAQELATEVAERVYRSDAMKTALETLAVGVGKEIGKQIEFASEDAAEPTLACLKAFVGARYGGTVARAVAGDAGKDIAIDPDSGKAEISSGAVLRQSGAGIAGVAVLLMRRQMANVARRVGQRIVGSVLARLVSVVAGGVGLVLIAKDIWDLRHGVLPIIASEMKSQESKDKVKDELAKTFEEQIASHVDEIGAATADRVVDIWRKFRNAHAQALALAARDENFKAFLDSLTPDKLPRLDEVVAIVSASEGEDALLKRLNDGTLNEAVNVLPASAMVIARETNSLDAALKWDALAGDQLSRVVELGIYKRTSPDTLTKASLERILALDDQLAITRIASLSPETRDILFELNSNDLKNLARGLTADELTTLARYLTGLQAGPREEVLRTIAADPVKMQLLASDRTRVAIVSSTDQAAAVGMMLRSSGTLRPAVVVEDVRLVADGRVSPILLWEKHPAVIVMGLFLVLIVLLLLHRLFVPRRREKAAA